VVARKLQQDEDPTLLFRAVPCRAAGGHPSVNFSFLSRHLCFSLTLFLPPLAFCSCHRRQYAASFPLCLAPKYTVFVFALSFFFVCAEKREGGGSWIYRPLGCTGSSQRERERERGQVYMQDCRQLQKNNRLFLRKACHPQRYLHANIKRERKIYFFC